MLQRQRCALQTVQQALHSFKKEAGRWGTKSSRSRCFRSKPMHSPDGVDLGGVQPRDGKPTDTEECQVQHHHDDRHILRRRIIVLREIVHGGKDDHGDADGDGAQDQQRATANTLYDEDGDDADGQLVIVMCKAVDNSRSSEEDKTTDTGQDPRKQGAQAHQGVH